MQCGASRRHNHAKLVVEHDRRRSAVRGPRKRHAELELPLRVEDLKGTAVTGHEDLRFPISINVRDARRAARALVHFRRPSQLAVQRQADDVPREVGRVNLGFSIPIGVRNRNRTVEFAVHQVRPKGCARGVERVQVLAHAAEDSQPAFAARVVNEGAAAHALVAAPEFLARGTEAQE